jgi:hypothetical protein
LPGSFNIIMFSDSAHLATTQTQSVMIAMRRRYVALARRSAQHTIPTTRVVMQMGQCLQRQAGKLSTCLWRLMESRLIGLETGPSLLCLFVKFGQQLTMVSTVDHSVSSSGEDMQNANNATHYVKLGQERRDSSKRNYYNICLLDWGRG